MDTHITFVRQWNELALLVGSRAVLGTWTPAPRRR